MKDLIVKLLNNPFYNKIFKQYHKLENIDIKDLKILASWMPTEDSIIKRYYLLGLNDPFLTSEEVGGILIPRKIKKILHKYGGIRHTGKLYAKSVPTFVKELVQKAGGYISNYQFHLETLHKVKVCAGFNKENYIYLFGENVKYKEKKKNILLLILKGHIVHVWLTGFLVTPFISKSSSLFI